MLAAGCERNAENDALSLRQELNPPAGAYVRARACTVEDVACQTLVDLYERKPGFKESLTSALAAADIPVPDWLAVALSTKILRQTQGPDSVVTGRACEPRNCAEFLYVGPAAALKVALYAMLAGGLLALLYLCLPAGRFKEGKHIPYAVAISIGAVLVLGEMS